MQLVFQDPYSSFDPQATVVDSVVEPLRAQGVKGAAAEQRVSELFDLVGPRPGAPPPLPARALGRSAPAGGHRPRARDQPEARRDGRAGERARRVDPGAGHQPARGPPARPRHRLPVHRARPRGRAPRERPDRGHVPRPDRRGGSGRRALRGTDPPVHARAAVGDPGARTRPCSGRGCGWCSRARSRRRPTRRRAVGSAPAAPTRWTCAPRRSRPRSSGPTACSSRCHLHTDRPRPRRRLDHRRSPPRTSPRSPFWRHSCAAVSGDDRDARTGGQGPAGVMGGRSATSRMPGRAART